MRVPVPPPDPGIRSPSPVLTATLEAGECRQDLFLRTTFLGCVNHSAFSYGVAFSVL